MPATEDEPFWARFVKSRPAEDIATQMRHDQKRCEANEFPSFLFFHLPRPNSAAALPIARCLAPSPECSNAIRHLVYTSIYSTIQTKAEGPYGLERSRVRPRPLDADAIQPPATGPIPPTNEEMEGALKVLHFLKANCTGEGDGAKAVASVIALLQAQIQALDPGDDKLPVEKKMQTACVSWDDHLSKYHEGLGPKLLQQPRLCYICRFEIKQPHPFYRALCTPCGQFNMAGSQLSLPPRLQLNGRTALVTGARVNLGYHVACRLLRCGARVVATTRYPHDAAVRYAAEPDYETWKGRLKIVGADFRTARDAFALVIATKAELADWGMHKLDILVNNAAQTLTDSVRKETRAIQKEQELLETASKTGLVTDAGKGRPYQPQLRGGLSHLALYDSPQGPAISYHTDAVPSESTHQPDIILPDSVKDDGRTELVPYFKSSWVQNLSEIPYEDVLSAHAVNTFVPLILCRELLPLMGDDDTAERKKQAEAETESGTGTTNNRKRAKAVRIPLGYIINVSSREGIFERNQSPAKDGQHVHTNMSKAALNMITETEAEPAWRLRRVAMNSVDPGYMSAAPEMETAHGGNRPIGWEDGAGRVLWPVAMGEVEQTIIRGRFLKHYGAVGVDPSLGRG